MTRVFHNFHLSRGSVMCLPPQVSNHFRDTLAHFLSMALHTVSLGEILLCLRNCDLGS